MTRKALVTREEKRSSLCAKYATLRASIMAIINDANVSDEEKFQARMRLQKLPRNSSPVRARRRCALTGRPRGNFRQFGISRNEIRRLALKGDIPGVVKASW